MIDIVLKFLPLIAGAGVFFGIPKLVLQIVPGWIEKRWRFNKERFDYFKSAGFKFIESPKDSYEERVDFEYAIKGFTRKQISADIVARALQMVDFLEYIRCLSKESRNITIKDHQIKRRTSATKQTDLPSKERASTLWRRGAVCYVLSAIVLIVGYLAWAFRQSLSEHINVASLEAACILLFFGFSLCTIEIVKAAVSAERLYKISNLNGASFRTELG